MREITTEITNVTIFTDGARVTRKGRIKLPAGKETIVIRGITQDAQKDSFRIKGKGDAVLLSINVRTETEVRELSKKKRQLMAKRKKIQARIRELEDEIELLQVKNNGLETASTEFAMAIAPELAIGAITQSTIVEFDTKIDSLYADNLRMLRVLDDELEKAKLELESVEKNIAELPIDQTPITTQTVEIELNMNRDGEIEIEVAYQVATANWRPAYDINLQKEKAKVKRIALVQNRTGESWNDVLLVVSTASARPVVAVEPEPLFITDRSPEMRPMAPKLARRKPAMLSTRAKIEEVYAKAEASFAGISVFELPQPISIPSDYREHPVTLYLEELESTTLYYWYAEEMAAVIARDEVSNGDLALLPGEVRVYHKGEYIGKTSIELVAPREKFKLGDRTVYDVKAEKKLKRREIEKTGLTRGKRRRRYEYELEIQNFSDTEIEIEIADRIPHSLDPSIEVKIDIEKLALEKFQLGIMKWKRIIPPNSKDVLTYSYEVEWEKDVNIAPPLP